MNTNMQAPVAQAASSVAEKVGQAATTAGSGLAVWFAMNAQIIAAFGGILIGIAGLVVTWYYKSQHLKLAIAKANEWTPIGDGE